MKETKVYKKTEDCSIRLDIYYQVPGAPTIVYFHGGALIFGSRKEFRDEEALFFKNAGFNVISVDYRLAPETKLNSIMEDVSDAVKWIQSRISEWYDMDTERLIYMGRSAGAYLALLLGTYTEKKPIAIVSLYGYGDILGDWYLNPSAYYLQKKRVDFTAARQMVGKYGTTDGSTERFLYYLYCRQEGIWVEQVTGLSRTVHLDRLRELNPIGNMDTSFPPTIFIHGNRDMDVPYEQSVLMHQALKDQGIPTELVTIENGGHNFDQPFNKSDSQHVFRKITDFLSTLPPTV